MSIPVLIILLLCCTTAVVVPWLGVVFYYMLAVGALNQLWPYDFGDSRVSLMITAATLVGLIIATATQQVDYRRLLYFPIILMALLVFFVNMGGINAPYVDFVDIKKGVLTPAEMIETFNKIMVAFFAAILLIDTRFKLVFLITAVGSVLFYYTLWANKIYVTNELWRFGDNGRLNGPEGVYFDENYLALLYVVAGPVFYYLAVGCRSVVIKAGLWFSMPFAWHALFLTGSRGALLAVIVTCLYIFFRSYSKKASIVLLIVFVGAVIDQSGELLNRVTETVNVEDTLREEAYRKNTDDSDPIPQDLIDPRVISWQVGLDIAKDFPVFGVGAGNFVRAFPDYHGSNPHVAHNTFVQLAATSGVFAGFIYLYFLYLRLRNVVAKGNPEAKHPHGLPRDYLDDLINCVYVGFYTVAFFLDLMVLEILYFVIAIGFCKYALDNPRRAQRSHLIDSIYNWRRSSDAHDQGVLPETSLARSEEHAPTYIQAVGQAPGQFAHLAEERADGQLLEERPEKTVTQHDTYNHAINQPHSVYSK